MAEAIFVSCRGMGFSRRESSSSVKLDSSQSTRNQCGANMSRRGLRLRRRLLKKPGAYYVVWIEGGRTRERSTGTKDSAKAQIAFARLLQRYTPKSWTIEPAEILVTEVFSYYLQHLETTAKDCQKAALASVPLAEFFTGKSLAEVPVLCKSYHAWRKVSSSTVLRDLGKLQSAIKHAF